MVQAKKDLVDLADPVSWVDLLIEGMGSGLKKEKHPKYREQQRAVCHFLPGDDASSFFRMKKPNRRLKCGAMIAIC